MTTQVLKETEHIHSAGGAFGVSQGQRFGLYEIMAREPATVFGLAREAQLPVTFVYRWLATQACEGYVHHDTRDGRYSLWCDLSRPGPRTDAGKGGAL